jgi:hypothetical protein
MSVIVDQKSGWFETDSGGYLGYQEQVIPLDGEDISAQIEVYLLNTGGEGPVGRAYIKQVVDADGTHDLDRAPIATGKGARSITFVVEGTADVVAARYVVNIWGDRGAGRWKSVRVRNRFRSWHAAGCLPMGRE